MRVWGQPAPSKLPLDAASPPPSQDARAPPSDASGPVLAGEEPPPPAKRMAKQLVKTRICKHHARGFCRYADRCGYAHNPEELVPRPNLVKTKMCVTFLSGACEKEDCTYAHGFGELRSSSDQGGSEALYSECSQLSSLPDQMSEDTSIWHRPPLHGKGSSGTSLASTMGAFSGPPPQLQGILRSRQYSGRASSTASSLSGGPQLSTQAEGEGRRAGERCPPPPAPWAPEEHAAAPQWALGLRKASASAASASSSAASAEQRGQLARALGQRQPPPPAGPRDAGHPWQQPHGSPFGGGLPARAPSHSGALRPQTTHAWGAGAPPGAGAVGGGGALRDSEAVMQVQEVVYQAANEAAQQVLQQVLPLLQGSEQQLAQDATMRMLRGLLPAHQAGPDPLGLPRPQGLTADIDAAAPQLLGHADAAAGPHRPAPGALDAGATPAALGPMGWPASIERELTATVLPAPGRTAHKWGHLVSRALAWRRKALLLEGRYLCAASREPHGAQANSQTTSFILQRSHMWASEFPELCWPQQAPRPPPPRPHLRHEGAAPGPQQPAWAFAPGGYGAPASASQPAPDYYQRVSL